LSSDSIGEVRRMRHSVCSFASESRRLDRVDHLTWTDTPTVSSDSRDGDVIDAMM
jgi:hypothetical protein